MATFLYALVFLLLGILVRLTNIVLPIDLAIVPIAAYNLTIGYLIKFLKKQNLLSHKAIIGGVLLVGGITCEYNPRKPYFEVK